MKFKDFSECVEFLATLTGPAQIKATATNKAG